MRELNATSEVQVLESSPSESMAVDFLIKGSERFQLLAAALRTLGFSAAQAKRRLEWAWESCARDATRNPGKFPADFEDSARHAGGRGRLDRPMLPAAHRLQ